VKEIVIVLTILVVAASCKRDYMYANLQLGPHDHPRLQGTSKSMYDSIVPPRLISDSSMIYSDLNTLLRIANNKEWDGGDSYFDAFIEIDEKGKVMLKRFDSTPSIKSDFKKILDQLLTQVNLWEPACLKTNPEHKLSYKIYLEITLREKEINFRMYGDEHRYFLRKNFSRPI
jgi:hypothetical protein